MFSFRTCLRLLKGKHESGRSHVTLFLTFGFHYQTIIEEFDKQCGLPIFFKVVCLNLFARPLMALNNNLVNRDADNSSKCSMRQQFWEPDKSPHGISPSALLS